MARRQFIDNDVERVFFLDNFRIGNIVRYKSTWEVGRTIFRVIDMEFDGPVVVASRIVQPNEATPEMNGDGHRRYEQFETRGVLIGCVLELDGVPEIEEGRLVEGAAPVMENGDGFTVLPQMDKRIAFYESFRHRAASR